MVVFYVVLNVHYCIVPQYITWTSCQKVTNHAHYGQIFILGDLFLLERVFIWLAHKLSG